jgi:DNA repair protein RadD
MFKLRDYQEKAIVDLRQAIQDGYRSILLVSCCGSGKGSIIAYIMTSAMMRGHRSHMVAHRTALVAGPNAIGDRLREQLDVPDAKIGYLIPKALFRKYKIDAEAKSQRDIVLGTVQTAVNRKRMRDINILIVDEAHRSEMPTYRKYIAEMREANPGLVVIGFTATPTRHDKKALGNTYDKLIVVLQHGEAVKRKVLVPGVYKYPVDVDLQGVKIRGNEFVEEDLEKVYTKDVLDSIIDKWEELGGKHKKTIFFTINRKKHARMLTELLRERRYLAEVIVSGTEDAEDLLVEFENNRYQCLVNVNKFTEGISVDDVECIVLAFATMHVGKYVQAASRGVRPLWGPDGEWRKNNLEEYVKESCLIIDCGSNVIRHGRLEDYGKNGFSIEPLPKRKKQAREVTMKLCGNDSCNSILPVQTKICPDCGYQFPQGEVEADKRLATEANWDYTDPHKDYFMKFSKENMSLKRLMQGLRGPKERPELLLGIGVVRGYRDTWAIHAAKDLNYKRFRKLDLKKQQDWATAERYLRMKTRQAGYMITYQNLLAERMKREEEAQNV